MPPTSTVTTPTPAATRSGLALRQIELLQSLSDADLHQLAHQCEWHTTDAHALLFLRDAHNHRVFFLVSGRVRLTTYSAQGREVSLRDCGPGSHFGDLSALDGEPLPADVITLEPCVLASLSAEQFHTLLRSQPSVAERLVRNLTLAVRVLAERVIELSTLPVPARLHHALLQMTCAAGVHQNTARLAPAPLHADLASRIGTNREQVTRELNALVRQGVLRKEGTRVLVVNDVRALQAKVEHMLQRPAGCWPEHGVPQPHQGTTTPIPATAAHWL